MPLTGSDKQKARTNALRKALGMAKRVKQPQKGTKRKRSQRSKRRTSRATQQI